MKDKKIIIYIILILTIIIVINFLFIKITSTKMDTDYQKLGLELNEYDIDYYIVYLEDSFGTYKVYKINDNYKGDIDKFKEQLENSELWNKNKYYEYVMMRFYDKIDNKTTEIDREDLYYYHGKNARAIFDIKNVKLYYFDYWITGTANDHNEILGIKIDNYIAKEVYCVKGGWQGDGRDYFTYQFTEEKGKEINNILKDNQSWSKEKLDQNAIEAFEYNDEVDSIENAYYYYKTICRTSDERKKYNFTDEEATGWEIGIYDIDNNILYYYWESI